MGRVNLADPSYVRDQYRASHNLESRIALHERFSTAKQKWFDWYWEHFDLPTDARILEIGCGTGMLWRDNRARVPATWRLTLSDFSLGMIESCATHLRGASHIQSDAQAIPFRDNYFDAVIANHMLYHVPDVSRALAEIRRVLKSTGKFYAATNGITHMREYSDLISEYLCTEESIAPPKSFSLENGSEQIGKYFQSVQRFDFEDSLLISETEPLVAYALSGFVGKQWLDVDREDSLRQFIAERIARDGAIRITKSTGLFIATN